jgi:hypothetical protein
VFFGDWHGRCVYNRILREVRGRRKGEKMKAKSYKVHIGGNRWRRFETLAEATAACNSVFQKTGIVLSIIFE